MSKWQTAPVPLPLYTCVRKDVFVVAPSGVGQIDLCSLEELGNEVSSHPQRSSAREGLDTCDAVLQGKAEKNMKE